MVAPSFTKKLTSPNTDPNIYDRNDIKQIQDIIDASHATQRIQSTSIEGTWAKLGQTILSGVADTITVSGLTVKNKLLIIIRLIETGGTIEALLRFNNDSGANYSLRVSSNGAADATSVAQTAVTAKPAQSQGAVSLIRVYVNNDATQEKVVYGEAGFSGTAGAANAPQRREFVGKWANTSDSITRIDIVNTSTGDFAASSEIEVWGID